MHQFRLLQRDLSSFLHGSAVDRRVLQSRHSVRIGKLRKWLLRPGNDSSWRRLHDQRQLRVECLLQRHLLSHRVSAAKWRGLQRQRSVFIEHLLWWRLLWGRHERSLHELRRDMPVRRRSDLRQWRVWEHLGAHAQRRSMLCWSAAQLHSGGNCRERHMLQWTLHW